MTSIPDPKAATAAVCRRILLAAVLLAVLARSSPAAGPQDAAAGTTLFAFDDQSMPLRQNLVLTMTNPEKHPANPILRNGAQGEPDSYRVQFYGSVIRHQGKFKLWYVAGGEEALEALGRHSLRGWYPAYAESDDGIHWTKPKLGLVEYRGRRDNNLLLLEGLSENAWLRIEVVDEAERPLAGGSATVRRPGVDVPVAWSGQLDFGKRAGPFRLKVSFEGEERRSIKLYALYLGDV
jgi:hypothetical protein